MTWNHRVIRKKVTPEEEEAVSGEAYSYTIHEVYYDDNGKPEMVTEEAMAPYGITLEELQQDTEWFTKALGQPILNYEDF